VFSNYVYSTPPSPHSFSGIIFYPNGSQVPYGTYFLVEDLTNGFTISGTTGRGPYSGAYAVSVDGNDNDNIILSAHTQTNYGNITFQLSQSMYDVDLVLDNLFPNTPPRIISTPTSYVGLGDTFTYSIIAEDDEDNIDSSVLIEHPLNMIISNNLITWTPDYLGNFSVTLRVYDIFNEYDEQIFSILVNGTTTSTTTTTTTTTSTTTTLHDSTSSSGSSSGSGFSDEIYNSLSNETKERPLLIPLPHKIPTRMSGIIPSYNIVGYVYISDGKHQVPRDTKIRIINLETGLSIETKTGLGPYPGAYSVILTGDKGDIIRFVINDRTYDFVLYGDMEQDIITDMKGTDVDVTKMSLDDLYYSDKKDIVFAQPSNINKSYWGIFYIILIFIIFYFF